MTAVGWSTNLRCKRNVQWETQLSVRVVGRMFALFPLTYIQVKTPDLLSKIILIEKQFSDNLHFSVQMTTVKKIRVQWSGKQKKISESTL